MLPIIFPTFRHAGAVLYCLPLMLAATDLVANDFPTVDRALFIQECRSLENSAKYETLYACACTLDKIAAELSYKEYVEADSYWRMRNIRGERGGLFRSGQRAREIRQHFSAVKTRAKAVGFLQQVRPHSDLAAIDAEETDRPQKK